MYAAFFNQSATAVQVPKSNKQKTSTAPENQPIFMEIDSSCPLFRRRSQYNTVGVTNSMVGSNKQPRSITRSLKYGKEFIKRNIAISKHNEITNQYLVARQNISLVR